jgi:hypothetical protein
MFLGGNHLDNYLWLFSGSEDFENTIRVILEER